MQPHAKHLVNRTISYVFYILMVMYVLSLFGVNLTAIWGAAGVAGLAIGFAAQTSVSNLISGIFVLIEKALKVGDYISVDGVSGTVDTIGLLSVTVHTLDNQYVRIPNSSIINTNLTNFSHFEKRRFVFEIPISYDSDMETALNALKKVPALCPTVLSDPAPAVFYDGFGDAVNLRLAVWFNRPDLIQTKNDVYINVVKVFKEDGVTIPFTRYDVKIVNFDEQNGGTKSLAKTAAAKSAEPKTGRAKTSLKKDK
jgi:small-conductance mechanosensitive channel